MNEEKEVENNDQELTSEISEVDSLNNKIAELNDKYLRAVAESENTRRRAQIDMESAARSRAISVAEKFLPLIDAINAALLHHTNDEGIKTLAVAAENTLAKIGITKIETVGQILNPIFHNAISVVDVPQCDEPCAMKIVPNMIVSEMQAGYMFGESVLRPAMVAVAK